MNEKVKILVIHKDKDYCEVEILTGIHKYIFVVIIWCIEENWFEKCIMMIYVKNLWINWLFVRIIVLFGRKISKKWERNYRRLNIYRPILNMKIFHTWDILDEYLISN